MAQGLKTQPTLAVVLDLLKEDIFSSLNCHAIGKVESFDSSKQRAQVSIAYSRKVESDQDTQNRNDYPIMVDVPIVVIGGGLGSIRFPIEEGDSCIVFFNDRDIDNWLESGSFNQLNSDRKHSFSDGIAMVGPRNKSNVFSDYSSDRTELVHDKTKISLGDKIAIFNQAQDLFLILNELLDAISSAAGIDTVTNAPVSLLPLNAAATSVKAKLGLLMEQKP